MTRAVVVSAGTIAVWLTLVVGGAAHTGVRALITLDPARPTPGEPCRISVRFESVVGIPQDMGDRRVRLVADMTGHAMRPVETELRPAGRTGEFTGAVEFTMVGPWRVVIQTDGHDAIAGTTSVEVALDPEPAPASATPIVVDVDVPDAGTPVSPWLVLYGALGLTALVEAAAVARRLIANRRRTTSAPIPSRRGDEIGQTSFR